MQKAVETGLVPKHVVGEDAYLRNWDAVSLILQAALSEVPSPSLREAPIAPQVTPAYDDFADTIAKLRAALTEYSRLHNPTGVAEVTTTYADKALGLK